MCYLCPFPTQRRGSREGRSLKNWVTWNTGAFTQCPNHWLPPWQEERTQSWICPKDLQLSYDNRQLIDRLRQFTSVHNGTLKGNWLHQTTGVFFHDYKIFPSLQKWQNTLSGWSTTREKVWIRWSKSELVWMLPSFMHWTKTLEERKTNNFMRRRYSCYASPQVTEALMWETCIIRLITSTAEKTIPNKCGKQFFKSFLQTHWTKTARFRSLGFSYLH